MLLEPIHTDLRDRIFDTDAESFENLAISIFLYQYSNNELYRQYCNALNIRPEMVNNLKNIPFLPIRFYKSHPVVCGELNDNLLFFESSGTTGSVNSRHYVKDPALYEQSFLKHFIQRYGKPENYCILGLLPSYLERKHASLVYMTDRLIKESHHPHSGFYLYDFEKLYERLVQNEKENQPTLLIGVSYALVDFASAFPMELNNTIVMETGGMKGRRKELTRTELHEILCHQFNLKTIHSEYGMTELLSQAYSPGNGRFHCPSWMKIMLRAEDDPLDTISPEPNKSYISGAVNIIDLANLYSCSFIATEDTGKLFADSSFEITGRLENSDIRGCGLMLLDH